MSGSASEGRVRHERHDHILKIIIDNPAKKNAFSPEMMAELSDALTLLDNDDGLWVGVLCAAGGSFTAGLDMPKFFGPTAIAQAAAGGQRRSLRTCRSGAASRSSRRCRASCSPSASR